MIKKIKKNISLIHIGETHLQSKILDSINILTATLNSTETLQNNQEENSLSTNIFGKNYRE